MSRRGRAVLFGCLAVGAAIGAAMVANGYGSSIARGFGPLRPVVIASAQLPKDEAIGPDAVDRSLEVRRVPVRFVPPGTLADPESALGLEPETDLAPGSYLQAQQLSPPEAETPRPGLAGGRRPVEIRVSGAGALLEVTGGGAGGLVDVVVTTEPTGPGPGKTYVAASAVPLLSLSSNRATLALRREQALQLIAAENFARQVTLLPGAQP